MESFYKKPDKTIEDPTSPTRKKNRQEEYSECQDEPVIDEACKNLITEYQNNVKKPNMQTDEQKAEMKRPTQKVKQTKNKFASDTIPSPY